MKMKRTVLYIAALVAFPAVSSAQLYVEPEQNVDCSVFIEKERGENAQQGLEIWDRYVFALEDGGHVRVFDFRTASGEPVAKFDLASARPDNHANNASFGIETAPGGSFPLLYVTNGKVGSEIEMSCFVESIKKTRPQVLLRNRADHQTRHGRLERSRICRHFRCSVMDGGQGQKFPLGILRT